MLYGWDFAEYDWSFFSGGGAQSVQVTDTESLSEQFELTSNSFVSCLLHNSAHAYLNSLRSACWLTMTIRLHCFQTVILMAFCQAKNTLLFFILQFMMLWDVNMQNVVEIASDYTFVALFCLRLCSFLVCLLPTNF